MAALASLFDDQADRLRRLGNFQKPADSDSLGRQFDDGGLALHLLQEIYTTVPPGNLTVFKAALNRVFQLELAVPGAPAQLEQAALDKGGFSVLLFRYLLENPAQPAEERFTRAFGGFVQCCDDCFDVWFDRQCQTFTLATYFLEKNKPEQLRDSLERRFGEVARAARQLHRPAYRRETALRIVWFLAGITRVCLRHYSQLKKKRGTLPLGVRRDMVVDMGRWRNRWRAFLEILKNRI